MKCRLTKWVFVWLLIMGMTHVSSGQFDEIKFLHYTSQNGLPSSYVKDIIEDRNGFIWLANRENLCRFDGYQFKTFPAFNDLGQTVDLRANTLKLAPDSLLICSTLDNRYYYFDEAMEQFHPYSVLNELRDVSSLEVSETGYWYIQNQHAFHLNNQTKKTEKIADIYPNQPFDVDTLSLLHYKDGRLILATADAQVIYLSKGQMKKFDLSGVLIQFLYLDSHDNLWVAGYSKLIRVDLVSGQMEDYSGDQVGSRKLPHNLAHKIVEDQLGRVWIATEGGVAIWTPSRKIDRIYVHELSNPDGLSSNPIYSAWCDSNGDVWLGSYFSGVNLWSSRQRYFKTLNSGISNYALGGNAVSCFTEDKKGNIWVGLEDMGVNRIDAKSGKILKYPIGVKSNGLSYGNVHDLYFETEKKLWIATYTGGINILDTDTKQFQYINTQNTPMLLSNDIYSFLCMRDSLFISTSNGINIYRKSTGKIEQFFPEVFWGVQVESMARTDNYLWFSSRTSVYRYDLGTQQLLKSTSIALRGINFVVSDSDNKLWVGDSFDGLYRFDPITEKVDTFNTSNGFQGSWVYSMEEGSRGCYWISTDKGLVKLFPETHRSVLFNADSGVPVSQFNYRASFKDSENNLLFGSNEGMIYFNEADDGDFDQAANQVALTGFKLFNQYISPTEDRDAVLTKSISLVDQIELDYDQNVFTIEYSAMNYGGKGRCHYAYYLEGFENDYNYVGNQNFATYTNLSPGRYTFKVKASLNNSNWDGQVRRLNVFVHPPFWLSKLGYILYAIIILSILILIYVVGARIQKSKAQVQIERKERAHAVELNQIKLEFFTNISHELRTPLTLIIGPLSKLLSDQRVSPTVKSQLSGIELNAKRLLGLLNQLLDFRKIERGKESLSVSENKIGDLFNNLEQSFQVTAEESGLNLTFKSVKADFPVWYDLSKIEKVLINLISNAFKFTDEGGQIKVTAKVKNSKSRPGTKNLHLTIHDSGRGMEPRVVNRIFDRFYQSTDNKDTSGRKNYFGSGIGLAFVHSLVELHKGKIKVDSKLNEGSIFEVVIPVSKEVYEEHEINLLEQVVPHIITPILPQHAKLQKEESKDIHLESDKRPVILLVEDNQELIDFVASTLDHNYTVLKAANGKEGLEHLQHGPVDLILSDVMMPIMDGFEFTQKVKTDIATSHIPIILLTAKSGVDNRYEGLKTGADYYIEKPFMSHILEQNIYNVLNTRRNLIHRFKRDAMMPAAELTHSESDKAFIDKLTKLIKDNITKPDLDVTFVMNEMALSRSMLHIKLKKIADSSATEFINTIRLKEALKLMADEGCNISEAAYRTGFSSPTYFTRRFKQYYGQSPREFLFKE